MTDLIFVDWSALAISLFNTILSLWLGLTILFNAERRTWGLVLAVSGLLASAAFFFSHSLIVAQGALVFVQEFSFWWRAISVLIVASPYLWYLLMLWYSGYWDNPQSDLHRRQKVWLGLSIIYTLLLSGLLLLNNPLPILTRDASIGLNGFPTLGPIPWIILAYPPYILICISLSLDALLRPAPSGRVMGNRARQRARPWLIGAGLVLFLVTLVASGSMVWLLQITAQLSSIADLIYKHSTTLGLLDLFLAALITVALLLLGQAVISYEVFTGKTLPRSGFHRQWRNIVLLAMALSSLAAWGVTAQFPMVNLILVILVIVAFTYAWFSWQIFSEREHGIQQLRPFASSQRLLEAILSTSPEPPAEVDLSALFNALCHDVLGTRRAGLVPLGTLAALGGAPLYYPSGESLKLPALADFLTGFTSPQSTGIALDPVQYDGAIWVAPLWSERGLNGLFFLGEKSDESFYSQEEIEIARAGGERLVDIQAITGMARRLMILQRQRLTESKVLDQQTRRILHDEVLSSLHTALLELSAENLHGTGRPERVVSTLASVHRQISDLLRDLPRITSPEVARLGLFGALRETISGELKGCFESVNWNIRPEVEQGALGIQPLVAEVAFFATREALRNAARHAHPVDALVLNITANWKQCLEIVIEDNGAGPVDLKTGSNGHGLTLHSTMMAVIGGSLALESASGLPTRVTLRLPIQAEAES